MLPTSPNDSFTVAESPDAGQAADHPQRGPAPGQAGDAAVQCLPGRLRLARATRRQRRVSGYSSPKRQAGAAGRGHHWVGPEPELVSAVWDDDAFREYFAEQCQAFEEEDDDD